jgi:hypothetical protein
MTLCWVETLNYVWSYQWKDTYEVFYLKSERFCIIFRRMAVILYQVNRDHVHHPTPLRPIILLLFDLRLIFHKFPHTFPFPRTFYLPRPFNHPLFGDYKIITDWTIGGFEPQWRRDFQPLPDWPQGPLSPLFNRYCFPLSKAMRPGRDFDHPTPSSAQVKHW